MRNQGGHETGDQTTGNKPSRSIQHVDVITHADGNAGENT